MTNNEVNDAVLMIRLAGGDMEALGDLVRRHQDRVLSLSYRVLKDWDRAEDVAQEVFLRVHGAAGKYKPKARFTTWLYRIVVNLCLDERRSQAKRESPLDLNTLEVQAKENYDVAERKEIVKLVKAAVNDLPERQRMALILHRYEGLSHGEIADVTGWTGSAVESLLVRAYASLREKLDKMKYFVE